MANDEPRRTRPEPRLRIDPGASASHAVGIAENLRRIDAALPPLPLRIKVEPKDEPTPTSAQDPSP